MVFLTILKAKKMKTVYSFQDHLCLGGIFSEVFLVEHGSNQPLLLQGNNRRQV